MRVGKLGLAATAAALMGCGGLYAQMGQPANAGGMGTQPLRLNIDVNGGAAHDLQPSDVTLLDNGTPAQVRALRQLSPGQEPTHVILVLDDVNANLMTLGYAREQLQKYLTKDEGKLPVPFTIAVMTDTKVEIQQGSSQDGMAENQALQKYQLGLHDITRSAQWGALDRTNIGIRTLMQLVQFAGGIPGRKLILFVSPGWPLLSGPSIQISNKQEDELYAEVARVQDALLRANVTLYMLNPFGPGENLIRADYYEAFLKGVRKPGDVQIADLSLQVLATHTGGTVQQGTSDIAGMMQRALSDVDHEYALDFVPRPGDQPNEYHELKLQLRQGGAKVRMPDEYYAGPFATGGPQ